jgi:hypothetical protein
MFSTTWESSTLSSLKLARRLKQIEDILLSLLGIIYGTDFVAVASFM